MGKKVLIAGGGHGGLCAGAFLAEAGFDVTVYERHDRDGMGYDWTDIFDPKALAAAGLPMPPEDKFEYKTDMTFYGPGEHTAVQQHVPADQREIKMERRDIYDLIIDRCEKTGVQFRYGCAVEGPLMAGDRVVGLKTADGDVYGDLVIDACGCNSPVRAGLPACCLVEKEAKRFEKFYVYRAFYDRAGDATDKYKVYLLPEGKLGIGWVACEEEYADLLIGRFDPFDEAEVERTADAYRKSNPCLGTERKRGGEFVQIPVRQPLSVLVADGYAAIGDSAFMTVPVIGSGIGLNLRASKMLADAVIGDATETYSAETLWPYQLAYFKNCGAGLAPLAAIKLLLTRISPAQLDYVLDNGILTSDELTITADSTSLTSFLHFSPDLAKRGAMLVKDKDLVKKLAKVVKDVGEVSAVCAAMPKYYSKHGVEAWKKRYEKVFS